MHWIKRKELIVYFMLLHLLGYYSWIYYWRNDEVMLSLGANTFSILAPIIATALLFYVYKRSKETDKYFWLLLSIGCLSYIFGEASWIYYENYLQIEVPYPGLPDLFYMFQYVFYSIAFIYKVWSNRNTLKFIKFIFDACILMTVALAFCWHFIIQGIIEQETVSTLYLFVSLAYPFGDLILLLGAISLYFGSEYYFSPRVLYLIVGSLIIQVFSDFTFLYLETKDIYISGGQLDPLWSLSLFLMSMAGIYAITDRNTFNSKGIKQQSTTYSVKDFISFKLLLPYISVILLFVVMVYQGREVNSLILGSAFAILLVVLRQIFTLFENQALLANYYSLNEQLEQKIGERTEELSTKNDQLFTAMEKVHYMAYHDELSGLPNRRLFLENLENGIDKAKQDNHSLAVVFIDLDRFKNINDTLGHEIGDLVLQYVSKRMLQAIRSIDTISRQGGDEFSIILDKVSREEDVIPLIKEIQSIVSKPFTINGHELHVSMSIGIALYPKDGSNAEELMKYADMAMYYAKAKGENEYKFFSAEIKEGISRKVTLENGLRKAVSNEEFILHYQPQINTETGRIIGVEALIRWDSSHGGMISPADFIPLAEETGLIIPIGEWVLNTACKQAKVWSDAGHKNLKLAVNLSPLQFLNADIVATIANVLTETGLNPHCLEIEITEGVSVNDTEDAILKMQALRDLGIRIAIDDFGTGYSSLIYLKRFPINALKIAQPFVKDITKNKSDKALVMSMISIAHSLGLSVIAEGVETTEQLQSLQELQCDEIQGYIFSKPLPIEQLTTFLETEGTD